MSTTQAFRSSKPHGGEPAGRPSATSLAPKGLYVEDARLSKRTRSFRPREIIPEPPLAPRQLAAPHTASGLSTLLRAAEGLKLRNS